MTRLSQNQIESKKLNILVMFFEKIIFLVFNTSWFWSEMLCLNLMTVYAKKMYHRLFQGIRKKELLLIKLLQEEVSNVVITETRQTATPVFAYFYKFFSWKFFIAKKSKYLFLLCVTLTSYWFLQIKKITNFTVFRLRKL